MEVTQENESFTRGCGRTRDDKPTLNFGPAEFNGSGSSRFQTPPMESEKCNFVQDALFNSLILKEIFTFLDAWDLESCSHVCQDWRSAADRFDFAHYDIKIERSHYYHRGGYGIFVRERDRYNRKIFTQRTDLAGFTEIFEVLLNQKVSIGLRLTAYVDVQDNVVMDLISKIGPFVLNLEMIDSFKRMSMVDFCTLLIQKFPNLKKLNCPDFDYARYNTDLAQNKHQQLRKISFGQLHYGFSAIETILRISPNLEEIEDFPLEMICDIVATQKGQCLKSLSDIVPLPEAEKMDDFPGPCVYGDILPAPEAEEMDDCPVPYVYGDTVVPAYRKLAELQPKLTSLEINPDRFLKHPRNTFELVKPYLFAVLQSSRESLESLVISPVRSDEIQYFPPLTRLKELELILDRSRDVDPFFPVEMPLVEIFPNVSKITLGVQWCECLINRLLPKNIPNKIRTQINQLSIDDKYASCASSRSRMAMMRRRFPFIQKLQIRIHAMNLPQCLLQICGLWPQLKSLSFSVEFRGRGNTRPLRLDRAFTGLPEKVIDQLEKPSKMKNFTQEQIQGFKDRSVICKLKELKELKLILSEYIGGPKKKLGRYMRLSPVANHFGFNLLPELKVTVDTQNVHNYAKEIKRDLEPLAQSNNIEIVDYTEQ